MTSRSYNLSLSSAEPARVSPHTVLRERLGSLLAYDGFEFVAPPYVMTVDDAFDKLGVPADAIIRSPTNSVYVSSTRVLTPHLTPTLLAHVARSGLRRCWTWGETFRARRESANRMQCELLCPNENITDVMRRLARLLGTILADEVTLNARPARFPGLILGAKLSGRLGSGWQGRLGAAGIVDPQVLHRYGVAPGPGLEPTAVGGLPLRTLPALIPY